MRTPRRRQGPVEVGHGGDHRPGADCVHRRQKHAWDLCGGFELEGR